ncbi:low temperature requirement protein A [Rhodopila sp.]|jgi:low temperature requirement protein LtrA|uniref:low temperature requirement protein A n=1 Tax=Rhodopila sp. TaxID=2480087 RepID=UPI002D1388A9|nr:low temperature requirement protein A [Rhodopila sp.]HVZ07061.1 low temperature requirement protein A [Rhodopila sp.]
MTTTEPAAEIPHNHRRRMRGRDPHEPHRVATPLELLFDLTFATSFGLAAAQCAHALAAGHHAVAIFGFGFASFAVCWAWINFSWFSSAYDTDDWTFRIVTMVQMIGVLILAIGLPRMFASIEHGDHLDNAVIVLGYVVMRVAMVSQWLRAARQDPRRRRACLTYAAAISIAQIGWVAQIFLDFTVGISAVLTVILGLVEMAGPVIAERKDGGTPWHAHHIAERYSLFAIIALGEGIVGTVASLSAVVDRQGWTLDAALVCIAGTGLTFGLWWVYSMLPSAPVLHAHRNRSFVWGYGQIIIIAAIVATGARLHVAAYFIEGQAHIGPLATLLTSAIPVGVFLGSVHALHYYLVRRFDPLHGLLLGGTAAMVALAIAAAIAGIDMAVCLVILMLAPAVTVVGYELRGRRYRPEALRRDAH